MITRTSPVWLPPPELLPDARSALRDAEAAERPPGGGTGGRRPGAAEPLPNPREAVYDAHFDVARTSHEPARTLLRALLRTTAEVGVWASAETRAALDTALAVCGQRAPAPAGGTSLLSPVARWRAGHRLFFALTAATVVALRDATARPVGRHPGPAATRDAALLLRASTAAMEATASFAPHAYRSQVRPSMEPPQERDGFSGLWSADHRALVRQLDVWGRAHAESCRGGCHAERALRAALADVHAAHHGICARFVGRGPSLLGGDANALRTLGRLASSRSRLLRPDAPQSPPRRTRA
ncbi:hypothetical protein GL263_16500 [Streptomyces durbertensis]|uniref:Uncharacterized protein n=1 Tax=Streptomyces durbertensis TaxID=2448886 RepID=A0ABR6EKV8_9ACTN|nr:hypothetical protein [Streptomyces durbertensis]MBB1245159.1 hypothetical protein [Streptomyces durbertensis]